MMNDITAIAKLAQVYAYRTLKDHDLNGSEYGILSFLAIHQPVNQDRIADYMMLDKGTITRIVTKLENKQLITRQTNPNNKREKLIVATNQGLEATKAFDALTQRWSEQLLNTISPEEQAIAAHVLRKMKDNAKNIIHQQGGSGL